VLFLPLLADDHRRNLIFATVIFEELVEEEADVERVVLSNEQKIINGKSEFEYRNPKQLQNPKSEARISKYETKQNVEVLGPLSLKVGGNDCFPSPHTLASDYRVFVLPLPQRSDPLTLAFPLFNAPPSQSQNRNREGNGHIILIKANSK